MEESKSGCALVREKDNLSSHYELKKREFVIAWEEKKCHCTKGENKKILEKLKKNIRKQKKLHKMKKIGIINGNNGKWSNNQEHNVSINKKEY